MNDKSFSLTIKDCVVTGYTGTLPSELVIPEGVTSIGEDAFAYCRGLTSVTIPASVTSIGNVAFAECSSLESVVYNGNKDNIKFGMEVFRATNLPFFLIMNGTVVTGYEGEIPTDLVIPEGVTSIGRWVFHECSDLTSVTISEGVTNIGDYAFADCLSLKSVVYNGNKDTIKFGKNVFKETNLPFFLIMDGTVVTGYEGKIPTDLVIPEGVTSIGDWAFCECDDLTSVTIPASVTNIGDEAFPESTKKV